MMKPHPAEMFKVLSVDTRVKILEMLKCRGALGAKDIAAAIGITIAAVSQHLKILKSAGLVRGERKGYHIPYAINEKAMERCRRLLNEVCTCGCREAENFRDVELEQTNLASLEGYEQALKKELEIVRRRVQELKAAK